MICVQDLKLEFKGHKLLQDISFNLEKNKTLAILGDSGAGKSLLGRSLIRLFNQTYNLEAKTLKFNEIDILKTKKLKELRSELGLVLQEAELSFYPYMDIGEFCHLILKTHTNLSSTQRKKKALECFERLGFKELDFLWHSYPHTLSVGMARRLSLALALLCGAKCLICDEINASLDEENLAKMLELLKDLKKDLGLILITHNLNFAKQLSDEVLILEKGKMLLNSSFEDFLKGTSKWATLYKELYA